MRYVIPDDDDPIRWFKLLFQKGEDINEEARSQMLRDSGRSAVDLIVNYLRYLFRHVIDTTAKSRGEFSWTSLESIFSS